MTDIHAITINLSLREIPHNPCTCSVHRSTINYETTYTKVRNLLFFLFCCIGLMGGYYFINVEDSSSLFFYLFLTAEYLFAASYMGMLYVGKVSEIQEERCAYELEMNKIKKIALRIIYMTCLLTGIIMFSLGYTAHGTTQIILLSVGSTFLYTTLVCGFSCCRVDN